MVKDMLFFDISKNQGIYLSNSLEINKLPSQKLKITHYPIMNPFSHRNFIYYVNRKHFQ